MEDLKLKVELFGKNLGSPLMLGSGTLVENYEQIQAYIDSSIGMIIPRTTRKTMLRRTHPVPHLYQTGSRKHPIMLNAEWTGADISYWRPYLKNMAKSGKIAMSVSGRDINDCVAVCMELENYGPWHFYEINLSCAHSNNLHGMITRSDTHVKHAVTALKNSGILTPIMVKLGHSDRIVELSCIAENSGADGLVLLNTYGPVFDFTINQHGAPEAILGIDGGMGGLSGASLFHIALTDIAIVRNAVKIPIIGCGGVCTAEDAIKMLMVGASAVQIYTAAHAHGINAPTFFNTMNSNIVKFLNQHSISNLSIIMGSALSILNKKTSLKIDIPKVNEKTCIGCDLCIPICLPKAINIKVSAGSNKADHVVSIDTEKCIGCGHCLHVCPTTPNSLEMSSLINREKYYDKK